MSTAHNTPILNFKSHERKFKNYHIKVSWEKMSIKDSVGEEGVHCLVYDKLVF